MAIGQVSEAWPSSLRVSRKESKSYETGVRVTKHTKPQAGPVKVVLVRNCFVVLPTVNTSFSTGIDT